MPVGHGNIQETGIQQQNNQLGRKVLSWEGLAGRKPGMSGAITCLWSGQEVYLLQDHHVDQGDAFWQVPQVSNVVVQKIVLINEERAKGGERTNKLKRNIWS